MWVQLDDNTIANLDTGKTYRLDLDEMYIQVNTPVVAVQYGGRDSRTDEHYWHTSDHEYVDHTLQFATKELAQEAWIQLVRLVNKSDVRYIYELAKEVRGA